MTFKFIVTAIILAGVAALGFGSAGLADPDGTAVVDPFEWPERISPPAPAVPAPMALPDSTRDVPSLVITTTSTVEESDGTRGTTTQVSTRTTDRVHVRLEGSRKEWLFERNPVDPARASGSLIDHAARRILVYDDSALRNEQGIRGWADVWTMRFDPDTLESMRQTGESTRVGGETFERHVASDADEDGLAEAWWSGALFLASKLVVRQSGRTMSSTITSIGRDVQAGVLDDPRRRFPTYEVADPADAGDRH